MGHHHEEQGRPGDKELTFIEKGSKLLNHWIQHNNDHIGSYRQRASEFRVHELPQVAVLLESAAELTDQINQILAEAANLLPSPKD
ncbi:MAG: hypothetical protein C4519_14120 [Desulfobacteraceae bacterium]|nr:MAG: hypothetical protein C4519_14120 [Desulfobacteraceae bacterium]